MTLSFLAVCIFVSGLITVAYGWTNPSLSPDRYRENLVGSLLAGSVGFLIAGLPVAVDQIAARRNWR